MLSSSYQSSLDYLFSLRTTGTKLGLESVRYLLDKLGSPDKKCEYIHIAGTNGKGSTAAFLAEILKSAGFKVGLFTSPHLVDFRERFQINSTLISKNELTDCLKTIDSVIQEMDEINTPRKPTFFEIVTAIGALHFAKNYCDIVVMETGMGGRLDATNAINSVAQVITKIGLDHTKWLGDSIEKIAYEKAGIIKQGSDVFTTNAPEIFNRQKMLIADDNFCRLTRVLPKNHQFLSENDEKIVIFDKIHQKNGRYLLDIDELNIKNAKIGLVGTHQVENAALAAVVADWFLKRKKISKTVDFIKNGLKNTTWRGRCQVFSEKPFILLDCAHNPDGMARLVQTLKEISSEKWIFIIGILNDKNPDRIIELIADLADEVYYIEPSSQRALSFSEFSKKSAGKLKLYAIDKITNDLFKKDKRYVICGSCYLVGDYLALTEEDGFRDTRTDDPLNLT